MKKRPNILFLMSDEHRADITGYEGNDIVRTPVLDELAKTGVTFTNAYTPSPICIPGRQSIMSGQFPRTTGCENYGEDLSPGYMTYARRFAQYGYTTAVSGKLHHNGPDQLQGWTDRISGDIGSVQTIEDRIPEEVERYKMPKQKWSKSKEVYKAGVGKGPGADHDAYSVQGALNFIESYFNSSYYDRPQAAPLLLKVSLVQPHYPYLTDADKFTYYLNRVKPYLNQTVSEHPFLSKFQVPIDEQVSERDLRRATAAYYGMIETIDGHYGTVMDALRHAGQDLDDWIIVYTSDHGEMLGEHGVWEKQKFYDGSARVPLIIRWPKGFDGGKVVTENVNLSDLFTTLCDLANLETPPDLDSRSLVKLLKGEDATWDNETVSQFGGTNLMIKQDHLKYQYYGTEMGEVLFDMQRNPEETINYIDDERYIDRIKYFRERSVELGFNTM